MKIKELNLVEEHLNSNNSPFRFNAKELDEETGNYYYGARYGVYPEHSRRDPKWSILALSQVEGWISVDPLAEQAPDWTPYRYGFNNPINYINPDGMFEYPGNCCPIPKEVKEFGNFLSNLVSDIFGLKPKKNKSETKKEKGLNLEVWGNNTNGDGIKGLEKSKDGSETLSVDMSKFTGMSNLGGKFDNMFNLLSVFSKLIVNKLFDKNSPYFSSEDDETFDSFKVLEDEHAGSKYKIVKYYLRNNQSNVKWTTIDTILDKEVNLDTLRKRKLHRLNIFDLSKRTVIDSTETQDHE